MVIRWDLAAVVLLASVASAAPASACALALTIYREPPPGVSSRQWEARQDYLATLRAEADKREHHARLWDEAEQVFVARIEAVSPRKIEKFWGGDADVNDVMLRPVSWLKGAGEEQAFTVGIREWSDCGPDPRWDALWGKVGDVFVVFVASGAPSQSSIREAMTPGALLDPRAKAALAAQ